MYPLKVDYCKNCSGPLEYCEFSSSLSECKKYRLEHHPQIQDTLIDSPINKQKLLKVAVKPKVTIKTVDRTKRKRVVHVKNLDCYGADLKSVAKSIAQKFATSASVSKSADGDEIVVGGDVADELRDFILTMAVCSINDFEK
jgi:density-regulated protein DRP1